MTSRDRIGSQLVSCTISKTLHPLPWPSERSYNAVKYCHTLSCQPGKVTPSKDLARLLKFAFVNTPPNTGPHSLVNSTRKPRFVLNALLHSKCRFHSGHILSYSWNSESSSKMRPDRHCTDSTGHENKAFPVDHWTTYLTLPDQHGSQLTP